MGILTNFLKLLKPEPNDFVDVAKHISENYDKLDQNAKSNNETLTNLKNGKLDKGAYSGNAGDLKAEIDKVASTTQLGRIIVGDNLTIDKAGRLSGKKVDLSNYYDKPEIEEKFKNFCPYVVGDIYITTLSTNPAVRFLGTIWEKIEGRFLLSTSGSNTSGQVGGSNTKTITQSNLPNVKLQVDAFSLGRGTMNITGTFNARALTGKDGTGTGAFTFGSETTALTSQSYEQTKTSLGFSFDASKAWTGMSTSASPYTSALGSGTPLDITPAYYTVHIWKRLS